MRIFESKLLPWAFLRSKINPSLESKKVNVTLTAREHKIYVKISPPNTD